MGVCMNFFLRRDIDVSSGSTPMRRWLAVTAVLFSSALGLLGCSSEEEPAATASGALEPQPIPAAVAQKPPSAEYLVQLELARSLLDANKAQEALAPLERCRLEQPEAFAVHNNLCVAYGILQRKAEAVAACEHALKIDPTNQLGKNNLGWVSSIKASVPGK
jgi:Flp pilus assembly protein TadD